MQKIASSRVFGLIVLVVVYLLAAAAGIGVFSLFRGWGLYFRLFAADVAATVFTWLVGLVLGNSSVYDPYWSVAPLVMLVLTEFHLGILNAGVILITAVVAFWSIRLTVHWWTTFESLRHQDWRYTQLKIEHPRLWHIVNLLGIHLFPTVVVFLALAPSVEFIRHFRTVNLGVILGVIISVSAVLLQYIADTQMRRFRSDPEHAGHVNRIGVWKYSRHPNYLGEILMWWGVCLISLSSPGSTVFYAVGALINTAMFVFVSVPMMERRQLGNKPEYEAYKTETGKLLPRLIGGARTHSEAPDR